MLKSNSIKYLLTLLLLWLGQSLAWGNGGYVGSKTCVSCHQQQFSQWQQSHHAKAMAVADKTSVLGDFNNREFQHQGVTTRFSKQGDTYFISIQEQDSGAEKFPVTYTFGFYPLQQYLLDLGDGQLQVYDVAWDSRPDAAGGQKWYKLLPEQDTGSDSDLHWKRHINNWNARCAECHSTDVNKTLNPQTLIYDTLFAEVNVACEACHGPAEKHLKWVQAAEYKPGSEAGFKQTLTKAPNFRYAENQPIAQAVALADAKQAQTEQINTCGGCHSRRQINSKADPGADYHDHYAITLLNEPLYHADGQIQDEVFVLGSFLQSKMYQQGVTCTHCHDPHSGEVITKDDGLCAQCHSPAVFATTEHHRHPLGSSGSECVNCHMPATTYMEIDDRRDHSFLIPHSDANSSAPSPCQNCHDTTVVSWASKLDDFAQLNRQASQANPLAWRDISDYIAQHDNPPIKRATLLAQIGNVPARLSAETVSQSLQEDNPLVRRAALDAAQFFPVELRWSLFNPLLDDPSISVQHAATNLLLPTATLLSDDDAKKFEQKLAEHKKRLQFNAGAPTGQAALAQFELTLGHTEKAISALKTALKIEPDYIPALLNLADIYRSQDNKPLEKQYLQQALNTAPDNAAVLHAYGLHLIREKKRQAALNYLHKATVQTPTEQRYFYVYAVALESVGQRTEAIKILQDSNTRWPNQFDTLMALVQYMDGSDAEEQSYAYLSLLSKIAPNHPEVKRRIQALREQSP